MYKYYRYDLLIFVVRLTTVMSKIITICNDIAIITNFLSCCTANY